MYVIEILVHNCMPNGTLNFEREQYAHIFVSPTNECCGNPEPPEYPTENTFGQCPLLENGSEAQKAIANALVDLLSARDEEGRLVFELVKNFNLLQVVDKFRAPFVNLKQLVSFVRLLRREIDERACQKRWQDTC